MIAIDIREKPRAKDPLSAFNAFGFDMFGGGQQAPKDGRYTGKWFGSTLEFSVAGVDYSVQGPTNFVSPREVAVVIQGGKVRMEA